jgi:hypothetical protein
VTNHILKQTVGLIIIYKAVEPYRVGMLKCKIIGLYNFTLKKKNIKLNATLRCLEETDMI